MINYVTSLKSFSEILLALGQRAQALRLSRNWTQQEIADRSGVGVATIHRFEKSGQVALENALRIATVLGVEAGFERLFEALGQTSESLRKRARKRIRKRS